ncbi:hypothetical protein [Brevundimonas naejangsanensis]|uniref:hypothetical protein n=2 Tax=Brevundimonas naejangsanensis TaxID=588932 RepID=UPI0026EC9BA9|nr:hypothetical protein [Brevundimonas naejangsanensis]
MSLYAICRQGNIIVKPVELTPQIFSQVDGIFQTQEMAFMNGINAEIDFTGDWKPDPDEVLLIRALPDAHTLLTATHQNAVALPPLNAGNFANEGVVGLFVSVGAGSNQRILIQNFGPQQLMAGPGKFSLLHNGNVFRKITEPAFSIGNNLVATINATGEVRFKSYPMIRRVLDVTPVFRAATDKEIAAFCSHGSLSVPNPQSFTTSADEGIWKQVMAISKSGVLNSYTVAQINAQAQAIGFPVSIVNGKIEIPQDRKSAKAVLSFLLNKIYLGPINQQLFITNSNRPF